MATDEIADDRMPTALHQVVRRASDRRSMATSVSVVIPTRDEQDNVAPLADGLAAALEGSWSWQLVFVDDSEDQTPERIEALTDRLPIRLVRRAPAERVGGLGGAVLAGLAAADGEVIVVMDADLQHPPELVPKLVLAVAHGMADVAIASRFAPGASAQGLSGPWRHLVTAATRRAAHLAVPRSRGVRDPLSGFFALHADVVKNGPKRSEGFKVLLDVLAQGGWSTAIEVPFCMGRRQTGASKAALREGLRFAHQLLRLRVRSTLGTPVGGRRATTSARDCPDRPRHQDPHGGGGLVAAAPREGSTPCSCLP